MKTKNMRKKALLSSVAMLLVAVVALGGATYAWFSSNTTATASAVEITTSQETSLYLNDFGAVAATSGWTDQYTITNKTSPTATENGDLTKELRPVSSVDGVNFFGLGLDKPADGSNTHNNYRVKSINTTESSFIVKLAVMSGKDDTELAISSFDYTSNATNSGAWGALRMAITVGDNATYIFKPSGGTATYAIANTGTDAATFTSSYDAANAYTLNDFYTHTTVANVAFAQPTLRAFGNSAESITPTYKLQNNEAQNITIKFWLEGNDRNADNGAIGQVVSGIGINFKTL